MRKSCHSIANLCSVATILLVCCDNMVAQNTDEIVVDTRGGVQVLSIPQPTPLDGLLATKLVFRTENPDHTVVTIEGLSFAGDVHQAWLEGPLGGPTASLPSASPTYHEDWIATDGHLFFDANCIACASGFGDILTETNDGSTNERFAHLLPQASAGLGALTGFGELRFQSRQDAFFFKTENQTNEVEFAYLVTTAATDESPAGVVTMSIGLLGEGIINSGNPGGAQWGLDDGAPLVIPFYVVPEPAGLQVCWIALLIGLRRSRHKFL